MSTYLSLSRAAQRASVASLGHRRRRWLVATALAVTLEPMAAQQLLDHVVARVGNLAITQTDVDSAVAFGVVEPRAGGDNHDAVRQLIDRRLMLTEVNRFPPPEPPDAAVAELTAKMKARAGSDGTALMKRTGADDKRLRELARDTLRLQAYITQRFGSGPQVSQQVERWVEDLRARGDVTEVIPRR